MTIARTSSPVLSCGVSPHRREWLDAEHGTQAAAAMLAEAAAEEAAAAAALGVRRVGTMDDLRCLDEDLEDRYQSESFGL